MLGMTPMDSKRETLVKLGYIHMLYSTQLCLQIFLELSEKNKM